MYFIDRDPAQVPLHQDSDASIATELCSILELFSSFQLHFQTPESNTKLIKSIFY